MLFYAFSFILFSYLQKYCNFAAVKRIKIQHMKAKE